MSGDQTQNFKGISSCLSSFDNSACLTKTIEFSISTVIFLTGLVLLFNYIRFFGFKGKIYINLSLFFMLGFLLMNMIYCFWNTIYPFYSIETYFHNLYILSIVIYTTKSYLIKQTPKHKLSLSRVSNLSNDSNDENHEGFFNMIKSKIANKSKFYKILYKTMGCIFFLLFTLIFITSLVGDIQSQKNGQSLAEDQGAQQDYTLFSFFKNSCEELWYLCVNIICVVLSMIVLLVLYKNYSFQKQKIRSMTLVTQTIHQKKAPFVTRDSGSIDSYKMRKTSTMSKLNNPLKKLALWMGLNIFGEIVNLVQSGLLLQANPANQCRIIAQNEANDSILKLFFVIASVYIEYSISIWFFYDTMQQKLQIQTKSQKLLIEPHEYSEQIRVGQIQLYPSIGKTNSSGSD